MKVLIPLVEGFDELEALSAINILRTAGIAVETIGIPSIQVKGSKGNLLITDKKMDMIATKEFSALVLVGGDPGYKNMSQSRAIADLIKRFHQEQKTIAAFSHAPLILSTLGILDDVKATVYPGFERELPHPRSGRVVHDKNIITSSGPGSCFECSLVLVETLAGKEVLQYARQKLVV